MTSTTVIPVSDLGGLEQIPCFFKNNSPVYSIDDLAPSVYWSVGVYLFCAGDNPLYVGSSYRIQERLQGHEKLRPALSLGADNIKFHFDYGVCPSDLRSSNLEGTRALEKEYIKFYQPCLNKSLVKDTFCCSLYSTPFLPEEVRKLEVLMERLGMSSVEELIRVILLENQTLRI
jgi:hypothetical protein